MQGGGKRQGAGLGIIPQAVDLAPEGHAVGGNENIAKGAQQEKLQDKKKRAQRQIAQGEPAVKQGKVHTPLAAPGANPACRQQGEHADEGVKKVVDNAAVVQPGN